MTVRKHSVVFYSPGTFFSESSGRSIASWDIKEALRLSQDISERYAAKPYGFRFKTYLVADPVPDGEGGILEVEPKEVASSGMHYITGKAILYSELPDTDEFRILKSNMECNCWGAVVENRNSYRFTGEFDEGDCIVDLEGSIIRRGNDPDIVAMTETLKRRQKERVELAIGE